jgi:NADH dehydrogenase
MSARTAAWVTRSLRDRGACVHLDTQVASAVGGRVVLSTGAGIDCGLLVWAAGSAATALVATHTDLPIDERGDLLTRADLRVGTATTPVPDAWAAGDDAAIPDLRDPGRRRTAPTAQHALRQGRRVAANVVASLEGGTPRPYVHRDLGSVASLGRGHGVLESGPVVLRGRLAWLLHRGYHVLAIPTFERKLRVLDDWFAGTVAGHDIVSLQSVQQPRAAFAPVGEEEPVVGSVVGPVVGRAAG